MAAPSLAHSGVPPPTSPHHHDAYIPAGRHRSGQSASLKVEINEKPLGTFAFHVNCVTEVGVKLSLGGIRSGAPIPKASSGNKKNKRSKLTLTGCIYTEDRLWMGSSESSYKVEHEADADRTTSLLTPIVFRRKIIADQSIRPRLFLHCNRRTDERTNERTPTKGIPPPVLKNTSHFASPNRSTTNLGVSKKIPLLSLL